MQSMTFKLYGTCSAHLAELEHALRRHHDVGDGHALNSRDNKQCRTPQRQKPGRRGSKHKSIGSFALGGRGGCVNRQEDSIGRGSNARYSERRVGGKKKTPSRILPLKKNSIHHFPRSVNYNAKHVKYRRGS